MAYNFGMAIAMPSLTLLALDHFPTHRAGLQLSELLQMLVSSVTAGLVAPPCGLGQKPRLRHECHPAAWARLLCRAGGGFSIASVVMRVRNELGAIDLYCERTDAGAVVRAIQCAQQPGLPAGCDAACGDRRGARTGSATAQCVIFAIGVGSLVFPYGGHPLGGTA